MVRAKLVQSFVIIARPVDSDRYRHSRTLGTLVSTVTLTTRSFLTMPARSSCNNDSHDHEARDDQSGQLTRVVVALLTPRPRRRREFQDSGHTFGMVAKAAGLTQGKHELDLTPVFRQACKGVISVVSAPAARTLHAEWTHHGLGTTFLHKQALDISQT
jgi:hypothetical protein